MKRSLQGLALLIVATLGIAPAQSATYTVTSLADSGVGSLRHAIQDANFSAGTPDDIRFASGLAGIIGLTSGELSITDDLVIIGPGEDLLAISGTGSSRVFQITGATVEMKHLTIADGFTNGSTDLNGAQQGGAGIRTANASLSLSHMILENNRVTYSLFQGGGAIRNSNNSQVRLEHVTVRNNEASSLIFAGGGAIDNSGTLTVQKSLFKGNRAANAPEAAFPTGGGAIQNFLGSSTILKTRFVRNQVNGSEHDPERDARSFGGAIQNFAGTFAVTECEFIGNSVIGDNTDGIGGVGGAISNVFGAVGTVDGSSIAGNQAVSTAGLGGLGGGIFNDALSELTFRRGNVNANEAIGPSGAGGGVYNEGTFFIDRISSITGNQASVGEDNVFGPLTLLP